MIIKFIIPFGFCELDDSYDAKTLLLVLSPTPFLVFQVFDCLQPFLSRELQSLESFSYVNRGSASFTEGCRIVANVFSQVNQNQLQLIILNAYKNTNAIKYNYKKYLRQIP